jgi:elongation factor Ts
MAEITAKQVQDLRAKTDLAMMDCKSALVEAGGDQTKAMEILRKEFADKMTSRADKEAANGRIGIYADDKCAALAELRCETDFVATNDSFRDLANLMAETAGKNVVLDVEKLKGTKTSKGQLVSEVMVDAFGRIKENISVKRLVRIEGVGAAYVHHNGKVAAAITCDKSPGEAGRHICMHIASSQMLAGLDRESVKKDDLETARAKFKDEVKGKPEQIIEKIVGGKLDKWYGERVLTEQPFVMDDKKTVGQYAKEHGFTIKAYVKMEVGGLG